MEIEENKVSSSSSQSSLNIQFLSQGAEGVKEVFLKSKHLLLKNKKRVYKCLWFGKPTIVKERFSKKYRHPLLDEKLTIRRLHAV